MDSHHTEKVRVYGRLGLVALALLIILSSPGESRAQVLGDPVDVSRDFWKMENVYFVGSKVANFDAARGEGTLVWDRYMRNTSLSFNKVDIGLTKGRSTEFPGSEYDENPALPFSISFVSPGTIRLRFTTRSQPLADAPSVMIPALPTLPRDASWKMEQTDQAITYTSAQGKIRIQKSPWRIEF